MERARKMVIEGHHLSGLKLPPVIRASKGRPKKENRVKGVLEEWAKPKRTMTCSVCKQKGHRRNKQGGCKNMPAPVRVGREDEV
mmetsp:Transcript_11936/g.25107  ORF Transcript_11936/g.25107 Transcript_11936/m.25107 type:complete len:84 (+) Transcript_11936:1321-1572(+)